MKISFPVIEKVGGSGLVRTSTNRKRDRDTDGRGQREEIENLEKVLTTRTFNPISNEYI